MKLSSPLPVLAQCGSNPYRRHSNRFRIIPRCASQQSQLRLTGTRSFVSSPFTTANQEIAVSRILPYPSRAVYKIIADVSQYSNFVPYCQDSTITRWSRSDRDGNRWPEEARLVIGWGEIRETFGSRIYCVPDKTVEAVSGEAVTTLREDEIEHHDLRPAPASQSDEHSLLTHLLARWTLRSFPYKPPEVRTVIDEHAERPQSSNTETPPREQTEVGLAISYRFANPVYNSMSAAAAPRVAERMIDAFEKRIASMVDGPGLGGTREQLKKTEGVISRQGGS